MTLNELIPSFGEFIITCSEAMVEKDIAIYVMFEMVDNPEKYNNSRAIKELLLGHIDMDAFIHITQKFKL